MNQLAACSPSADAAFGPAVKGCRDNFDFTLTFEQVILSVGTSGLLLLFTPIRIAQLHKQSTKTLPHWLLAAKLVCILVFGAVQFALLALWSNLPQTRTRASIAAACLASLDALGLALLTTVEHKRCVRPSQIICVYLFFSSILDLSQVRTLWLQNESRAIASLFTTSVVIKLLLLLLESVGKRSFLQSPYRYFPPEALAGVFSTSIFFWVNQLIVRGYRNIITIEDLFGVDQKLSSGELEQTIMRTWAGKQKQRHCALLQTVLTCFVKPILNVIVPRICVIGFRFSQPLLINRAVRLIDAPISSETRNYGYGLIGATALIYIGLAVSKAIYQRQLYRLVTMLRGSLVCLIFDSTLGISEGEADKLASVTLMSTDIDRIITGFTSLDSLWAGPIEASIAVYLLERELGVACVLPVGISLACTVGAFSIMKWASNSQKEWVGVVQKRVATTAAVIMSIKIVKMQGLTDRFSKILHDLRVEELAYAKPFRRNIICTAGLSNIGTLCAPVLTFMMYILVSRETSSSTLNIAQAFTSLSLISLLSTPVSELVQTIPTFAAAVGCLDRVETYIRAANKTVQHRSLICKPILPEGIRKSAALVRIPSGVYEMDKMPGDSFQTANANNRGHLIMTLDDVSIRYIEQGQNILNNITMQITRGSLTIITGPVGCGKTTLAKAFLGELPCSSGSIQCSITEIAYCASESWLPNQPLREIVLGGATYEQGWYEMIVQACALRSDIATLSKGDQTIIGSQGASLSGGQKQRLALARAVYARKQLIILDSALSSLDVGTDESIYRAVLGPQGLCKRHGFTVVCFTHTVRHTRWADHIISIGSNGTIEEQYHQQDHIVPALDTFDAPNQFIANSDAKADPSRTDTIRTIENEEEDPIDLARRSGDLSLYAYLVRVVGWPYSILFLFTVVLYALSAELQIILVQYWSAADSSGSEIDTNVYFGLYGMLAGLGVAGLVSMLAHMLLFAGPKLSIELHRILTRATMGAPLHWFVSTDSGITLNRFSQDMSLVDMDLLVGLIDTAAGLAMATVQAVLIVLGAKYAAIALPFIFVAVYVLQSIYLRTSRQLRYLDLETKAPLYSHFLETCSGLTTIRAFGWQAQMAAKNRDLLDISQRPFYLLYCVQRWLGIVLDLIVAGTAVVLMTLATQVRSTTSGGALGVALVNVLNFNITLGFLIEKWTALETSLGAVARVKNFEKGMLDQTGPQMEAIDLPKDWPSAGELVIENLSVAYKPASSRVLHHVSIHVPGGQRIGIIGRTGSGKSSLILSVLRQISLETGSVIVDGVNLNSLSDSVVCHALVSIPQELCLLPGTVRSNADPFDSVPDAVITATLDTVGLLEVVRNNGGLDADMVSVKISRGQQQLFGVARALCRKKALGNRSYGILLLDETTSDVDVGTEQKILTVLADRFKGWTTLNVAHRLEALRGYDRIIVLEEGRVIEDRS